jgi:hypothetical protein
VAAAVAAEKAEMEALKKKGEMSGRKMMALKQPPPPFRFAFEFPNHITYAELFSFSSFSFVILHGICYCVWCDSY